jgi:hypothetical protein
MNIKRKRKRRTASIDMCSCGCLYCDSFVKSPAKTKIQNRIRQDLCPGCGKKECKCKHKGLEDYSIPVKLLNYKRR